MSLFSDSFFNSAHQQKEEEKPEQSHLNQILLDSKNFNAFFSIVQQSDLVKEGDVDNFLKKVSSNIQRIFESIQKHGDNSSKIIANSLTNSRFLATTINAINAINPLAVNEAFNNAKDHHLAKNNALSSNIKSYPAPKFQQQNYQSTNIQGKLFSEAAKQPIASKLQEQNISKNNGKGNVISIDFRK